MSQRTPCGGAWRRANPWTSRPTGPSTRGIAWVLVLLALAGGVTRCHAQLLPPGAATPAGQLVSTVQGDPTSLADVSRNQAFLDTTLDERRLEELRAILGRETVDGRLALDRYEGRSVRDLLRQEPDALERYPQLVVGLARIAQDGGAPVFLDDRSAGPLEIDPPGRIVPALELQKNLLGPDGSPERFQRYLEENFRLSPQQVDAFNTFLALSRDAGGSGDGGRTSLDGFGQLPRSGSESELGADATSRGLYLPPEVVLDQIADLTGILGEFEESPDRDPARFKAGDGRGLVEVLAQYQPSAARQLSTLDVNAMSPQQIRAEIRSLVKGIVDRERQGPNRYLFEKGMAFLLPQAGQRSLADLLNGIRLRSIPGTFPVGNGRVGELNDELYRKLILDNPDPTQRDYLELESGGDFFAIRGRPTDLIGPDDVERKHYDPPIDGPGTIFGAGMNLESR